MIFKVVFQFAVLVPSFVPAFSALLLWSPNQRSAFQVQYSYLPHFLPPHARVPSALELVSTGPKKPPTKRGREALAANTSIHYENDEDRQQNQKFEYLFHTGTPSSA